MLIKVKILKREKFYEEFLNKKLSLRARGLAGYLLYQPKDELCFDEPELESLSEKDRSHHIFSAFKELEKTGFLILKKTSQLHGIISKKLVCYETRN